MPPLAMVLDMKKDRNNRIVKNQYRPRRDIDAIKANLVHQTGSREYLTVTTKEYATKSWSSQ